MKHRKIEVLFPENIEFKNIRLDRFKKLPLLLLNHDSSIPFIGNALDISDNENGISLDLVFNEWTTASKKSKQLYDDGFVTKVHAGGYCERDKNGNIILFDLHEVSICQ